jgi:hypothetical protein
MDGLLAWHPPSNFPLFRNSRYLAAYIGFLGLRADIGDEISFANGAHNNLRVTFGPYIRF